MTRKKNSLLRPVMIIALIIALNLLGISYGYWQDNLMSMLQAHTGYVELSLKEEPIVDSDKLIIYSANLESDEEGKKVEVTGAIESTETEGVLCLSYTVKNNGSLPVEFDKDEFQDNIDRIEGFTLLSGPEGRIESGKSSNETIIISVDATKLDYTETVDPGISDLELDGTEKVAHTVLGYREFNIPLPYYFNSWSDELNITGRIDIIQSNSSFTTMLAPMPAMTFIPVEGGTVTDGLTEGPSDEELYGEGGTTLETDEPESPGDQELYGEGGTTEEADEPENDEDDNAPSSEGDDEEEGSNDELEEDDSEEAVQEDSKPADETEGEEKESGNQEQADGGEATEETDEPEEAEDNSEPASAGDGEGESSDDQVQTDVGEGN